ncbi:unnamed protein product [Adineta ricciae]|uniref:NACHT domain-containing protein n=1 Tax=Adineta ricciae TaxID=249248 RepID=A0A816DMA0_ADIRI|nr:unnamed protein product [Adineta ricciae]
MDYVKTAKNKCNRASNILTLDESAAIYLYSMSSPVYNQLNSTLRAHDRTTSKLWFPFLKLLTTALKRLPSIETTVWRGVSYDDTLAFVENDVQYWWSVNSCSKAPNIVKPFLGEKGTIFAIDVINGKDISTFAANCEELEVILMPGSRVRRKNESLCLSDHIILHLEEISSDNDTQLGSNYLFDIVKQNYLYNSRIERLINPTKSFPIEQSYINLSVVTSQEQHKREQKLRGAAYSDHMLSSYEEIYGTKSPIDIQNIFQSCEKDMNQVLVFGRAGIGKSTFCRYVTYQWAKGAYWPQYDLLALIPLRRLTANRYPPMTSGQNYSLIDVLKKEVFSCELSERENALLEKQFDVKNILWVLDGYDEIIQNEPGHLEELLEKLLKTPHHIVTSRPYLNTLSYHAQMEITGFTDENIGQYIQQFFDQMKNEVEDATVKHQTLMKFLKSNPSIWGVAHIPVNLELICSLCSNQDWSKTEHLSITTLYSMITEWLCRRYLKTSNDKISQLPDHELYQCCRGELKFLERLAFTAMENNTIIIRPTLLKRTLRDTNIITQDHPHILNIGILKSFAKEGVGTQIEMNKEYYFVHLSFQEYFAARYWTNTLSESSAENVLEFVQRHKYNQRYALVFTFMAGLLSENDEMTLLNTFWNRILQEPLDLVGLRHIELIVICLGEISSNSNFPRRHDFLLPIAAYMQHNLLAKNQIILQHLAHVLRKAPFVICEEIMITTLIALLQRNEADVKTEVLQFICSLNVSNIPSRLSNSINALLTDNSDEVKIYACDTIGILGEQSATLEILNRLVNLLDDKNDRVRRSACYSLGRMGEKVGTAEFVSKILHTVGNESCSIHLDSFSILITMPEKVITEEIVNLLVNALNNENDFIRSHAYDILMKISNQLVATEMISRLTTLLEDRRDDVVLHACTLLDKIGEKAGVPDVINKLMTKALKHESFLIRVLACSTLSQISQGILPSETLSMVLAALKEKRMTLKENAFYVLAHMGQNAATAETINELKKATKHENEYIRASACNAFMHMKESVPIIEINSILMNALDDEKECVRASACKAAEKVLARQETSELLMKLKGALNDESFTVKLAAFDTLCTAGEITAATEIIDALINLLEDKNEHIRRDAHQAIVKISVKATTTEVIDKLVKLLEHRDAQVRGSMCHALEGMCEKVATNEVIEKVVGLLKDPDTNVRASACTTLCLWSRLIPISWVADDFIHVLGDEDEHVRHLACIAMQNICEQETTFEVIPKLVNVLEDENMHVRDSAYFLLGCMREKVATTEVIAKLVNALNDENRHIRSRACQALFQVNEKILVTKGIETIANALIDDDIQVRANMCFLLRQLKEQLPSVSISRLIVPLNGDDRHVSHDVAEFIGKNLNSSEIISELGSSKILELCESKFASICLKNVSEEQLIQQFIAEDNDCWYRAITNLALVRETAIVDKNDTIVVYGRKGPLELPISSSRHDKLVEAFKDQREKLHLFYPCNSLSK